MLYVPLCSDKSSYFHTMMFHSNKHTENTTVRFIIFIAYLLPKKHIKKTTVYINQHHRNNTVFLIVFIKFQIFEVPKYILDNIPWYTPTLRKFVKTGNFFPFVSMGRPTRIILVLSYIHAKAFFSVVIISEFLLRKINAGPNIEQFFFAFNDYNVKKRFTE